MNATTSPEPLTTANRRVTGYTAPAAEFQFLERDHVDFEALWQVLNGEVAGVIFRNVLSPQVGEQICKNFWASPSLRQRGDGVPAYYVGTYHFKKDLAVYLDEAEAVRKDLFGLFEYTNGFVEDYMAQLTAFLKGKGVTFRVAQHAGRPAADFVMRSWSDAGKYALEPHDDAAQLGHPKQEGFEIRNVLEHTTVALNICLQNGRGGQLHYWNMEPDEETRTALGLTHVGYPYPLSVLEGIEKMVVEIRPGDIYYFNGAKIHAVQAQEEAKSFRTTISGLLGFRDAQTVIYWA